MTAPATSPYVNFNCDFDVTEVFYTVSFIGQGNRNWSHEIFASSEEAVSFASAAKARLRAAGINNDLCVQDLGTTKKGLLKSLPNWIKNTARQTGENFLRPAAPAAPKTICRSSIMRRAHEIAKTLQGDRIACMSEAMRQAWAEAKAA